MKKRSITFRRGQAEAVLWRVFCQTGVSKPHPHFRSRIKRLIDVDRSSARNSQKRILAFGDKAPRGQGEDAEHSEFDVFCLAIGLELLDAGFKQGEVIYLLQEIRPWLKAHHQALIDREIPYFRGGPLAKDELTKQLPIGRDGYPDPRVYAVIDKVELKEVFSPASHRPTEEPVVMNPTIFLGITALTDYIDHGLGHSRRKALIIEIWSLGMKLHEALKDPPDIRRGRPSGG